MTEEAPEDVELDEDVRRYIDGAYAQLDRLTYYALLGLAPTAEPKAVKNAYYRLAGVVHPDRYFGKRLGNYKAKMEELFTCITSAYETLSSAPRRAEYDASLAEAVSDAAAAGEEVAPAAAAPVDPRLAAKREAAIAGLKQHFADGKAKAKQYADAAARARAAGDVVGAADAYRSALTFAPGDPELTAAYEETQRVAAEKLAESHMRKALIEEKFGRWAAAAESWQRVMSAKPNDPEIHARLANAIARAGRGS